MEKWLPLIGLVILHTGTRGVYSAEQPNIIFIIVDDLGWNDVGFHGSNQIPTPNIDVLAYNGIILNSHYVQSYSTPTRAALLSGIYPMKLGMQGPSFLVAEKKAMPKHKLLPEYFKDMGYESHLVGKWHLGYSRWNETPTLRGFDHHFGFYNSYCSYYDYLSTWTYNDHDYTGFELRKDGQPEFEEAGKYATDLFTEYTVNTINEHDSGKPLFLMLAHLGVHSANRGKPLEAPQETINKFRHIVDANRRTYAAMVSKIDDSMGSIVTALDQKNMLSNTIIVFISDNGAPTTGPFQNWGSNLPLRGIKDTLFEGGVRSVSFIWSPLLVQTARVSTDLMHVTDWFPTLFSAAGGDIDALDPELDGIDVWSSLIEMSIILKTGFVSITHNITFQPQTMSKGKLLVSAGHVRDVEELKTKQGESSIIQAHIIRQTSITLTPYKTFLKVYDLPSPRNDILLNIDEKTRNAGLRFYNWKLIVGTSQNGSYNDYFGHIVMENIEDIPYNSSAVYESPAGQVLRKVNYSPLTDVEYENIRYQATIKCTASKKNPCDPATGAVCLYDIPSDPCEENDLAKYFPSVVRRMKRALVDYRKSLIPQIDGDLDIEAADPKLFKYTWSPWVDCADTTCNLA